MSKASDNKSIAEKMAELNKLVDWFESDNFSLEKALEKFAEAEKLAKEIEYDLKNFKNKITVIKKDFSRDE